MQEAKFLLKLIEYIINGRDEELQLPADFNQELFVVLAQIHNLAAMVHYGLKKYGITLSDNAKENLEQVYLKGAYTYASNYAELEYMQSVFDKNNINYVLLKGAVLRELYPLAEMRTSCDIDFLCERSDRKKIEKLMTDNGFEVDNYEDGVDCYKKRPFVCFEIHRELLPGHDRFDCFDGVRSRTVALNNTKCGKKLGLDDTYLYMITHTAKHFFAGGTGVRSIIDLYLFRNKYENSLNLEFINERLNSVKLKKFSDEISALANFWFANGAKTELTARLSSFVLLSGVFGTKDNADAQEITYKKHNSVVNRKTPFFSKVFLSYNNMCLRYAYLKKHPYLLPVAYLQRIVTSVFSKEKRAKLGETVSQNHDLTPEKLSNIESLITELQIF